MFPEALMGEEWQMTESHHFPADAWVQGVGGLDIHCAVDTAGELFARKDVLTTKFSCELSRKAHHMKMKQDPSFWFCLVPYAACTSGEKK